MEIICAIAADDLLRDAARSARGMRTLSSILLTSLLLTWECNGQAREPDCEPVLARVISAQGEVELKRAGAADWHEAEAQTVLCPGDSLRVASRARAAIGFADESVIRLDALTTLTFPDAPPAPGQRPLLNLLEGIIHLLSREPMGLQVDTPFVNAAVEGTEFVVASGKDGASVLVLEGRIRAANPLGSVDLQAGEQAVASRGTAPSKITVAHPFDAVRWALYYPPVITLSPAARSALAQPLARYRSGDVAGALHLLEEVPLAQRDAEFRVFTASLLLRVGRVGEAEALLRKTSESADTLALRTIIALAQGENAAALALARRALEIDPQSAPAQVALSYALQAHFELEAARAAAQRATELAPETALTRARLSELQLAVSQVRAAVASAQRAVALDPGESRAYTALGFAYLLQYRARDAQASFERAITLDDADPLPRLGLGLAQIRRGALQDGRRQIEIAVSLDPGNSLLRSYLGKAYFDERRSARAMTQYELAKTLDEADPTPWYYEAILDQTINRPVAALQNIEGSISRNDNRAVYRSRLALDADLAARSASQARIYRDLGFDQRALVEAYGSVNTDPSNFSAHRFLSQSYTVLPRHQIARSAELLQSQLWQPLNINPLPPQLAQTDLAIVAGTAPAMVGGNDLNPLFTRDRIAFQGNLIGGGNGTLGDDAVLSGLFGRFSFALSQFHYETDGWRDNADLEQDLYGAYLQGALSDRLSLQLELQGYEAERGDTALRFDDLERYSAQLRESSEVDTARFGLRYDLSPRSHLLASIIGRELEETTTDQVDGTFDLFPPLPPVPGTLDIEARRGKERPWLAELQHVYRAERFNTVGGIGLFDVEREDTVMLTVIPAPPFPPVPLPPLSEDNSVRHGNAYLYSGFSPRRDVTWYLGLSYDDFEGVATELSVWNPKLGVNWTPTSSTTVRAAAFKTLKRDLVTDQTVEPTQVAGFNQFFDDPNGTRSTRVGFAVDQRFSPRMFAGIELTQRSLEVPVGSLSGDDSDTEWNEWLHRLYWNWTPTRKLAISAEYLFEKLDYSEPWFGVQEVTTQRVPLSLRYFWRSAFSAGLTLSYIDQQGLFDDPQIQGTNETPGRDQFWYADAALSYRLPKRYGMISLIAKNLFDADFSYQESEPQNPTLYPERLLLGRVTVSF
jgi:tetratricopeptide (TPR) repeat protein